ncbi:RNA methyltransferase [Cohnella sp. CFH 77786]|uniref:TrmH family RNA methyltransferase n=1 Tax=Cohnella sp. CFH 77786 TaxID=2662265 RepID=UPI001C60A49F|nr:RNA methyltransferase [Cohnella sp. CFH 77786]MBW5447180.1 RNA methyltransferase [Cohnella sp. CFH 77786]
MPKHEAYISSVANPRVKEWSKLTERKYREREGKFLLEGIHLVKEALQAEWPLLHVAYDAGAGIPDELAPWAEDGFGTAVGGVTAGPSWVPVSPEVIARCSQAETPQPVFAVAEKRRLAADKLFDADAGLVAVLDGVQDPGNVGTIVRGAAASGATAVVLGRGTADLYNAKTLRASMGALFHVPVVEGDLTELLPAARERGMRVVGTSLQAAHSCYEYDFRRGVWLVFGSEGSGLSTAVSEHVHDNVIIPMTGRAESLNVAMAATVLLFEVQRQRLRAGIAGIPGN